MAKLKIQDLPIIDKKILVRVDFNVPQDEKGQITDDTRIVAALPTIKFILEQGGAVILMSHLGRPKAKRDLQFSMAPCAKRLAELLGRPVAFAPDCVGSEVQEMAGALQPGEVLLLENLRFHKGEEKPDDEPEFVKELAILGDCYVNDAFGTAHRAHASTTLIASYFPNKAAAGFLMQKEIQFLGEALLRPKHPFYAIIGGAKVSSKLGVLHSLINKVDALFIGGGMAYTFFKAQGIAIGDSICEDELLSSASEILNKCREKGVPVYFPIDLQIAERCSADAKITTIAVQEGIPDGYQGFDMGPLTIHEWSNHLKNAKTIFWNGPVGVAELAPFAVGTRAIAQVLAASPATTVVGGGDSIAALQWAGLADKIDHVSTGGGASLEYIEFGKLPGVEALSEAVGNPLVS